MACGTTGFPVFPHESDSRDTLHRRQPHTLRFKGTHSMPRSGLPQSAPRAGRMPVSVAMPGNAGVPPACGAGQRPVLPGSKGKVRHSQLFLGRNVFPSSFLRKQESSGDAPPHREIPAEAGHSPSPSPSRGEGVGKPDGDNFKLTRYPRGQLVAKCLPLNPRDCRTVSKDVTAPSMISGNSPCCGPAGTAAPA